ncbi:MAG: pyridoxal phosphate-dependent aminotransferase [Eubacteriales bacterium]|nr:pyridoxal phosphate-dependent aminotransferase [Eubacteriales bacterium]MDD4389448.1 pyridoxal phosphate-dependent aminotransferase [Eubacteriales bacterium]
MRLSERVNKMEFSPIRKFNPIAGAAKASGVRVYHLNIGQPDIETPAAFMEAIRGYDEKVLAYAESPGLTVLQDAIINYFKPFGVNVDRSEVLVTSGGSEALSMVFTSILNEGDTVMIPEPYYTNYRTFIAASGGEVTPITADPDKGYMFADEALLEASYRPTCKAIAVVNPGNPTGTILSTEDMEVICRFAKKHDLWVIADEVYREFAYDGRKMVSFGQLEEYADRVIIIDSISKRFSACGARIGFIIAKNKELNAALMKIAQGRLCCPTLEMLGAAALYQLPSDYFNAIRTEYENRRNVLFEGLSAIPGVKVNKPGGAFYMMVTLPVENAEDFLMFLLEDFRDNGETMMYAPAEGFYATPGLGKNEVRLAYVLNAKDLRRSTEILAKALEAYKNR